ncbi:MFS transporter [Neptuniibacter caesariensis]|uniref:Membrane transport protein n=1 Tax=Neptuniibacter caesariensis TaxID=207954 RepID=A0A7U8GSI2_NEPCE|nr:MFS transporter [Neptuniibacter caesariensis]EAR61436.1 membrane transport protein [Oceanospirillum sp. MED92] [Neptuniibacter caesariensis]
MIESGTKAFWRATLALCLGSFMIFANLYVPQPLLPMLADEFAVTPLQASWSLTVTTLTLGLSLLLFGPLSDALGRTRLMVISMCGAVLCCFALSQVTEFNTLILLRAIQGICLAGLPAIAIAYMGDEFKKTAMLVAVGLYISGNTLGGIGGRLIGGFMGDLLGWQSAFAAMSLISLICLCLFVWLLPESNHFKPQRLQPAKMLSDIGRHLRNPLLLLAYLFGGFNFFIFINQYSYVTFLLADEPYYLTASVLGMLFLTYLSGTLGSAVSGRFAHWLPQPLVMAFGVLFIMLGSLLTLVPSIWAIIMGLFINAFGFFVAHSTASSWVSHHAEGAKATASSIYLVFYYLGASSGGFYLDPFWQMAGWYGVIYGSLLVLCATLLCALVLYHKTRRTLVAIDCAG